MGCGASKAVRTPSSKSIGPVKDGSKDGKGKKPVELKNGAGRKRTTGGAKSRPEHHISKAAVSLTFLQQFVEKHSVRDKELTTAQLVAEIIKPATAANVGRYTDMMLRDPALRGDVSQGKQFYFVSHAWSRKFCDTLDMVARHFEPEQQRIWRQKDGKPLPVLPPEEVFVWLDIFAVNQHQVIGESLSDLDALWEAVQDAEATLVVLDAEGTLLTRIWCMYEAWQTSRVAAEKLSLLTYGIRWKPLEKVISDLDVGKAQATAVNDRDRILDDIRREAGSLDSMTQGLRDALVAGALAQVPPADRPWDARAWHVLHAASVLCGLYGKHDQAESLARRNLDGSEAALGPDHDDTLDALVALASALDAQGKADESEPLHRRALAACEKRAGKDAPETLAAADRLAASLRSQAKPGEAEAVYRRVLTARQFFPGPSFPDTLLSMCNLAGVLEELAKFDEAENLYRRALRGREEVLGPDHMDTLHAASSLVRLLVRKRKYDEADTLSLRAMDGKAKVLGPDHPEALAAVIDRAQLFMEREDWDEAKELLDRAVAGLTRTLGKTHPQTVAAMRHQLYVFEQKYGPMGDEE